MKRFCIGILAALLLTAACGCAAGKKPNGETEVVNPVKEVDGASAFEPMDLYIDAPDGASDVRYSTISDKIAQVVFTLDGHEYTYRAAHTDEDITGLYVEYEEIELHSDADGDGWTASVRVRTIRDGGGMLAEFAYGTAKFSLYTPDPVNEQTVAELAVSLASVQCPHYAD